MDIKIRPAERKDELMIFEWSNDPLTREMSFDQEPILLENHRNWYQRILSSTDTHLFVVEAFLVGRRVSISQMRIDHKGVISFSLSPDYRGKGYGTLILSECLKYIKSNLGYHEVIAWIKQENIPSIKTFEKAGFKLEGEDEIKEIKCFKYKLIL